MPGFKRSWNCLFVLMFFWSIFPHQCCLILPFQEASPHPAPQYTGYLLELRTLLSVSGLSFDLGILGILTVYKLAHQQMTICVLLKHLWERLRAGGEGDDRGWDGWMASSTRWPWVWVDPGSWWWTGRPGVLWFMGSQRVGHDWATELNWS